MRKILGIIASHKPRTGEVALADGFGNRTVIPRADAMRLARAIRNLVQRELAAIDAARQGQDR